MPNSAQAQEIWQNPPEPIATFLDAPFLPQAFLSPDNQWLLTLEHPPLAPIADIAQPRIQVAGIQINPATHAPALEYGYRSLTVQHVETGKRQSIPLPENAQIRNFRWSPGSRYLAFTHTRAEGMELWVLDVPQGKIQRLLPPILNGTYGNPCDWISDHDGLVCKIASSAPAPEPEAVPAGPRIEENLGREAPARTYTNLLETPHDEALFEHYLTSIVEKVGLDGSRTPLTGPLLVDEVTPAPNGKWILLETIERPFSYQVPVGLFPRRVVVIDRHGQEVFEAARLPLADDIPVNFTSVRSGRRVVWWRADRPATLYWVEALDGGDSRRQVAHRDAVYQLDAPFTSSPQQLWQTELRFSQLRWGNGDRALAYEYWYDTRQLRTWLLNPDDPTVEPVLLDQRNAQDSYANPGSPVMAANEYGWYTLVFADDNRSLYLEGRGASPEGVYPFLDRWDLTSQTKVRLWQAQDPYYERVERLIDNQAEQFITRRQGTEEPPNFWLRDRQQDTATALTNFDDPLPWFQGAQREIVSYQRSDGLELSATLYLPPNYEPTADGPLPTLLWVYPEEYKSRTTAAQITSSENSFSRPWGVSPLFLLTQGYAVMMGPSMPIIGEGEAEPNDAYIQQLTLSAQAAVDYLVERGVGDRNRMAIAGQSYGAFTTANLLAHTELFETGIALSGAYNRTLTPFGFQGEQRTFWQARNTYMEMSPFTHADQIDQPLLLIHGAEDANAGTYPMQSERLYGAMRGLAGTVRWVEIPHEGHGFRSREAIGHTLWEMTRWLDTYLAPAQPDLPPENSAP